VGVGDADVGRQSAKREVFHEMTAYFPTLPRSN
jgi:hypothetical protein